MAYDGMPVEDATDKQFSTLMGLKKAIDKLSDDRELAVADFLLRVQIFEFNLKYLWQHYGFKDNEKTIQKEYDQWTLGDIICVLEKHNDKYFSNLIPMCHLINKTRVDVIHHILDNKTDYDELLDEVIAKRATIDRAQQEMWNYLEWDKSFRI